MTDVFTPEKRSSVMRQVKGKGTAPELAVRRLLTGLGLRYRLHRKDLPGAPDVVMAGRKLAIFVHGCFWHGHDCARGARVPKQNRDYWLGKIGRNRARDAEHQAALEAKVWTPLVIWECELKDEAAVRARLEEATASSSSSPVLRGRKKLTQNPSSASAITGSAPVFSLARCCEVSGRMRSM